ncbi:MAG: hypothetical protein HUJ68_03535 [Clostridia bacterium]|nr:hypothetical protein [Clostridia bacterium]
MEIEKRWLWQDITNKRKLEFFSENDWQKTAYLFDKNSLTSCRFRCRPKLDGTYSCKITVKTGKGLSRIEIEKEITKEEFDELTKDLYVMTTQFTKIGPWEIKCIDDKVIIEREFDSIEEAISFDDTELQVDLGLGIFKDVTNDSDYNVINFYKKKVLND